jgi:Ni,Fe-hydrogenase III small subunit
MKRYIMKKIIMGLAPLLAVAAFAVMPAMASAATTHGTCAMPTAFVAQNGAEIHESTKIMEITVTGCPPARAKVTQITPAQRLKAALHACRRQDKRNKRKRAACEALARRRFGP